MGRKSKSKGEQKYEKKNVMSLNGYNYGHWLFGRM